MATSLTNTGVTFPDATSQTTAGVPPTGTGASGTWGISISGNAATATTASNGGVTSVNGSTGAVTVASGGDYVQRTYSSSTTWTKPAGLKAVKVTVVSAGGNGGGAYLYGSGGHGGGGAAGVKYISAPSLGSTVSVSVGTAPSKTSSFGGFITATGGVNGTPKYNDPSPGAPGAGGSVSGADYGLPGAPGSTTGNSSFGWSNARPPQTNPGPARAGSLYGGGGTGAPATTSYLPEGLGGSGIVIVEEFY